MCLHNGDISFPVRSCDHEIELGESTGQISETVDNILESGHMGSRITRLNKLQYYFIWKL